MLTQDINIIYTFIRHEDRIGLQHRLKQTDRQTNKHYNKYQNYWAYLFETQCRSPLANTVRVCVPVHV